MKLKRRPKTLKIWLFEAWYFGFCIKLRIWWFAKWFSTEISLFCPTRNPECKKTDEKNSVQSSLKSHTLCRKTLYVNQPGSAMKIKEPRLKTFLLELPNLYPMKIIFFPPIQSIKSFEQKKTFQIIFFPFFVISMLNLDNHLEIWKFSNR